jgi:hypothetical protein
MLAPQEGSRVLMPLRIELMLRARSDQAGGQPGWAWGGIARGLVHTCVELGL